MVRSIIDRRCGRHATGFNAFVRVPYDIAEERGWAATVAAMAIHGSHRGGGRNFLSERQRITRRLPPLNRTRAAVDANGTGQGNQRRIGS